MRTILGYGVAGSLDAGIPQSTFVVADPALPTDGTTKSYDVVTLLAPERAVVENATQLADRLGLDLRRAAAATVDALYRETVSLMADFRSRGAQIVNMQTSPLYAASAACGVSSLWFGYVTDLLVEGKWHDWFVPIPNANATAVALCPRLIEMMMEHSR